MGGAGCVYVCQESNLLQVLMGRSCTGRPHVHPMEETIHHSICESTYRPLGGIHRGYYCLRLGRGQYRASESTPVSWGSGLGPGGGEP